MSERAGNEELTFRRGGGCLALFGLPFLVAGMVVTALAALGKMDAEDNAWVAYLVGPIFAFVGAVLVFGRAETAFDPVNRRWYSWWGMLGFKKMKQGSLDDITSVEIEREVRRGDKRSYVVFPVKAKGAGDISLTIREPGTFEDARQLAERLCKGISVPLVDRTGDEPHVVNHQHLDANIKQKLRAGEEKLVEVPEPPNRKSVYEVNGRTVRFDMPAGRKVNIVGGLVLALVVPSVVIGVFFYPMLQREMPSGALYIFGGFLLLFFVLLPIGSGLAIVYKALYGREKVEVSPEGITVETVAGPFRKRRTVAANEIEEVVVRRLETDAAAAITVVSDRETLRFGAGLGADEMRWIAYVLKTVLSA